MLIPKALFPLLGLWAVACINLPDIEDARPGVPASDGGTLMDGGSDGGPPPGPADGGVDQTAPAVIRTSPPNGATRVLVDSTVEVDFSEGMMASTLRVTSVPSVTFTLSSWAPELRRAVFSASAPLEQDRQYTLSVEGKDLAGNPLLSSYLFTFTTLGQAPDTTSPTLLLHSPAAYANGIPRQGPIKLTFSEPMNKPSVEQAFSIAAPVQTLVGTSWNTSGTEVYFTPVDKFPYGSEVIWSISTAAKDLAGNSLPEATVKVFYVVRTATVTLMREPAFTLLVSTSAPPQTELWAVGDDSTNEPYHGFVSFGLQSILDNCGSGTTITSAVLAWPYSDPGVSTFNSLGRFVIDPVYYFSLENAYLYSRPSIGTPLSLSHQDFDVRSGYCHIPVTNQVTDAWNNRDTRSRMVQLRLKFETTTDNDNNADAFWIEPGNMALTVTCERP